MVSVVLLILGFIFLVKGANFLVDGASSLAKRLRVSELIIGLTIVAFGTSSPELFVNILASAQGKTDIAIGNILGSNIFNILFILGICAFIYPLRISESTIWKEIPFSLLAAVLVGVLSNDKLIDHNNFSILTRIDGLILISFFFIFLYYIIDIARAQRNEIEQSAVRQYSIIKVFFLIIIGLLFLIIGARLVVKDAVELALLLGVSQSLIALTVVAIGTSLPELVTSVVATYKKNIDIAVGNVVGSNIFNIFFILGISAIIKPLSFVSTNAFDTLMTIFASAVLFIAVFTGKRKVIDFWEGAIFVLFYVAYTIFIIIRK